MSLPKQEKFITQEEYLEGEKMSDVKHEYIDGDVYAMAGTTDNHGRISASLLTNFYNHLKNSTCEPFMADIKVKVNNSFFYPDVMVACNEKDNAPYYRESPIIIVEVLSKSTRRTDQTIKRRAYQSIASLQEYILIEQDIVDIEVCRKFDHFWQSRRYYLGDDITLKSIDLTLSVEDIYHRVNNDDMIEFINQQST